MATSISRSAVPAETPLMAQYRALKESRPEAVLFFRLGDFYEMFGNDAVEVSKLLGLTLTHRGDSPMCGIPYHSAKRYVSRLLSAGKKIAVAEQIGEIAPHGGLTERKIVEVITPGAAMESEYLAGDANNFMASLWLSKGQVGFCFLDVSTGEFAASAFSEKELAEGFCKEMDRRQPKELLLSESLKENRTFMQAMQGYPRVSVSWFPDWRFNAQKSYQLLCAQFNTANLSAFSLTAGSVEVPPAGLLLEYAKDAVCSELPHVSAIQVGEDVRYLSMDGFSRRNLELLSNLSDGTTSCTLLETVNHVKTAMGGRLLRSWLSFPLTRADEIKKRQDLVQLFFDDRRLLKRTQGCLDLVLDVERLASRIATDRAHAKDLRALEASLSSCLEAGDVLDSFGFSPDERSQMQQVSSFIDSSIDEDPATTLTEGRLIKRGFSKDLDYWRDVKENFNAHIEQYANEEREATGIQNLKVKNTGNLGWYIEVTRSNLSKTPAHFIPRRNLLNASRFTTEKLKALEDSLNESSARILEIERELFLQVRDKVKESVPVLLAAAKKIALMDVCCSLAQSAAQNGWVRPEILAEGKEFYVKGGRHPVVESQLPSGEFVPNDLSLCTQNGEGEGKTFALITGPNMAGKSTFLRQNALIALLAQTGSFVPASEARIALCDKIFCRVGASDNLARGESTFLVEMSETARILRSATERSLVIMDEVGRGTGTEDGLSIAQAVSEYLIDKVGCKTLFATHYHELTRLEHPALVRLCMAVSENGKDVVFLRKVVPGSSENSYGLHVARLAGVPEEVVARAQQILDGKETVLPASPAQKTPATSQKTREDISPMLFAPEDLEDLEGTSSL